MKNKFMVFLNILANIFTLAFIPLFVLWLVFKSDADLSIIFLSLWLSMLITGLTLFLVTYKTSQQNSKMRRARREFLRESIKIKARHGKVIINTNANIFKFKKIQVHLSDIMEFQLVNNQAVINKSGIGESFVGGMLFGGTGAIAGAMVGKKQKVKDNYKVFIKTQDVKHAGIVVSLKIDNAYNLFETLKLITNK